jgi:ribosomal protein S18 acetylase RimI-like enzyme
MAFIVLSGNPTEIFQSNWSYIRFVSVHPNHSGKGIGKYLTQLCIDFAKQNNEQTVVLHTSEFMNKARHIYESLGFAILKELEPRLGEKYWLYTLTL